MGQTQSVYGNKPNIAGIQKYIREKHIANSIAPWKELLHEQKHVPNQILKVIVHLLGPFLLIIGLISSFVALYLSVNRSKSYGLQNILVDSIDNPIPASSSKYNVSASQTSKKQIYSLRGGEYGRSQNIILTLPSATLTDEGTIIYVRNTGIETITASNTINTQTPDVTVIPGTQTSLTLQSRKNINLICSSELNGVKKWYPALLPDGAI